MIGVTGGIATGKTLFCKFLERKGYLHLDADYLVRRIYGVREVKSGVKCLLGPESYFLDGSLNKSFVARKVFYSPSLLKKLENILYPKLKLEVEKELEKYRRLKKKDVSLEAVKLFEGDLDKYCTRTIGLVSSRKTKLDRLSRRGISTSIALAIMSNQLPNGLYEEYADCKIINEGTKEDLKEKALSLF